MFSSSPNYSKLKTNLRLAVNRLKLLEKKKTELAQKSRKEIADYLSAGKIERAKIRVETIIREDYLVEAMEVVEMYCDLLLARFGLLQQMKELDDGIAEPVSSLLWVAPRLQSDVEELRVISDVLIAKYGKEYAESARTTTGSHKVSEKLMHKLALQAPPKLLVEKYLIEIAKIYNIPYEPDPQVMKDDLRPIGPDGSLIDLGQDRNNLGGGGGAPAPLGFIDFPQPPQLPVMPYPPPNAKPFNYPEPSGSGGNNGGGCCPPSGAPTAPFNYNIPPYPNLDDEKKDLNTFLSNEEKNHSSPPPYSAINPDDTLQFRSQPPPRRPPTYSSLNNNFEKQNLNTPKPQPRSKMPPSPSASNEDFSNLPTVPTDLPDLSNSTPAPAPAPRGDTSNNDDIDFDDLSRRFEELKKKK